MLGVGGEFWWLRSSAGSPEEAQAKEGIPQTSETDKFWELVLVEGP